MLNFFYPPTGLYGANDLVNSSKLSSVASENETLRRKVAWLEANLERQALASQAMWELVQERLGVEEQELLKKIEEVDLRDGVADGRISPADTTCPSCGRTNRGRRPRCLYCGTETAAETSPFENR